jgi:hypothetical protein
VEFFAQALMARRYSKKDKAMDPIHTIHLVSYQLPVWRVVIFPYSPWWGGGIAESLRLSQIVVFLDLETLTGVSIEVSWRVYLDIFMPAWR